MDVKLAAFLVLAVAASGCAQQQGSGSGVVVERFSAADSSLSPNQQTVIEAEIVNYNEAPTTVSSDSIELFNTGQLEVLSKSCNPDSIGTSREGFNPTMVCSWTVEAPGESFVKGFESKPLSVKMRLPYETTLENEEALNLNFQPVEEIESTSEVSRSVSNGDVTGVMTTQNPANLNGETLNIEVSNTGPGSVEGSYNFDLSPEIASGCSGEEEPVQGEAQTSCVLDDVETPGSRNLFISISYKYEKSPNLDIEVVNN